MKVDNHDVQIGDFIFFDCDDGIEHCGQVTDIVSGKLVLYVDDHEEDDPFIIHVNPEDCWIE